jgi:hypothetical protein
MPERCAFEHAYRGRCTQPAVEGTRFCADDLKLRCGTCQEQATHSCDYTGQFVCGALLCDRCEGIEEPGDPGTWGFTNHRHRRKLGSRR